MCLSIEDRLFLTGSCFYDTLSSHLGDGKDLANRSDALRITDTQPYCHRVLDSFRYFRKLVELIQVEGGGVDTLPPF